MLPSQIAFAGKFQKFGEPALVYLLGQLESEDEGERKIVGAAISQFEEIDERCLQRILVGIDGDVPWRSRALRSIHTQAAAKIAVELYMKSTSSTGNSMAAGSCFMGIGGCLFSSKLRPRVNWAAAESLGRIGDKSALDALEIVRRSHWYPGVRNAADKAITRIYSLGEHKGITRSNYSHSEFFRYEHFEIYACNVVALKAATRNNARKVSRGDPEGVRQTLAYDSYVLGFGASDGDEQRKQDPNGIIVVHSGNIAEHRDGMVQVPDVALKVESGWLADSSRGEFGGELMHIPDEGQAIRVLNSNVEGIHLIGSTIVAVTGLAHLFSNEGMVYSL